VLVILSFLVVLRASHCISVCAIITFSLTHRNSLLTLLQRVNRCLIMREESDLKYST